MIGSTRVARRAGKKVATIPATSSAKAAAAKVSGSNGLTPWRKNARLRVTPRAMATPSSTPSSARMVPWRITIETTSPYWAPSAIRMPISWVRCETE